MSDGFGGCGWGGTPCGDVVDNPRATVENVIPVSQDINRGTTLGFDIVYAVPLSSLVILVAYDTGATEVVYNSEGFTTNFRTTADAKGHILFLGSERQVTAGRDHFIIRRRSGWPFSPSLLIEGADGKAIAQ